MFTDQYQDGPSYTFTYVDEKWPKGWHWKLRHVKSGEDSDVIEDVLREHGTGRKADDARALLLRQTASWTVRMPKDFKTPRLDEEGNPLHDDQGVALTDPHPYAGKVPPVAWEYMLKIDEGTIARVLTELFQEMVKYNRGDVADQAEFRASDQDSPAPAEPS